MPIRFDLHWADCLPFLPFDGVEASATAKVLDIPMAAACWLSRFLGPQAA
jgi:hypothetical protein